MSPRPRSSTAAATKGSRCPTNRSSKRCGSRCSTPARRGCAAHSAGSRRSSGACWPELEELGEPLRSDPETERYALFEAIAALLESLTRERPALLVLDDLHWAARPTLLLLRHVVRSERAVNALIVATYRETELDPACALAQLLADLQRDASAARIAVRGLGTPAIETLVRATEAAASPAAVAALVTWLKDQTTGNPFFIRELLAHLRETQATQPWSLDVPEGLRRLIATRIARLSAPTQRALEVGAVAAPVFSPALVERVAGAGADGLEEAAAAGLLLPAERGQYTFAHALVPQAIYGGLGPERRTRLHRRVAEALEQLRPAARVRWPITSCRPGRASRRSPTRSRPGAAPCSGWPSRRPSRTSSGRWRSAPRSGCTARCCCASARPAGRPATPVAPASPTSRARGSPSGAGSRRRSRARRSASTARCSSPSATGSAWPRSTCSSAPCARSRRATARGGRG